MPHVIAERYELDREIGRGGMGAVWLGHDLVLERAVALKQVGLLPGSDRADVERVRREARVSAMLNHPNVVGVFDLVTEGERHWLVMEYVECETLADLIGREGSLSPDALAPVVAQAAHALAAAHTAGIVHRDVKPSNILVCADGTAKLGDFGIARTTADPTLTQTGLVTGSPGYMAPEVASGRTAGAAADVWSIGATVYHALVGRPPYDTGENLMAALYRLVNEDPPRTELAGWLEPLLLATMHRDPAGRWTAAQVANFLGRGPVAEPVPVVSRAIGGDGPPPGSVPGPPPSGPPPEPPSSWSASSGLPDADATQLLPIPRRRLAVPLVAAVLLVLGIVMATWLLNRGDSPGTSPADSGRSPATSAPAEQRPTAAGMEAFISDYLSTVANDPVVAWTKLTPNFQTASGGYAQYIGWWGGLEKATVRSIKADPADLTVTYDVRYDWAKHQGKGKLKSDKTTLELTFADGQYLIDYEQS
jgi:serine/threonine protein kinase